MAPDLELHIDLPTSVADNLPAWAIYDMTWDGRAIVHVDRRARRWAFSNSIRGTNVQIGTVAHCLVRGDRNPLGAANPWCKALTRVGTTPSGIREALRTGLWAVSAVPCEAGLAIRWGSPYLPTEITTVAQ